MVTDYYSSLSSFTQLHTLLTTTLLLLPPSLIHTHATCKKGVKAETVICFNSSTRCFFANKPQHRNKWDVMQQGGGGERGEGGDNGPSPAVSHRAVRKPGSKTCQQMGWWHICQHAASIHLSTGLYSRVPLLSALWLWMLPNKLEEPCTN